MGAVESCELDCGKRQRAKMLQEKTLQSPNHQGWGDFGELRDSQPPPPQSRVLAFRPSGLAGNGATLPPKAKFAHYPVVFSDIEPDMLPPKPTRESHEASAAKFSMSGLEGVLDPCCSSRHEDSFPDSRKQVLNQHSWGALASIDQEHTPPFSRSLSLAELEQQHSANEPPLLPPSSPLEQDNQPDTQDQQREVPAGVLEKSQKQLKGRRDGERRGGREGTKEGEKEGEMTKAQRTWQANKKEFEHYDAQSVWHSSLSAAASSKARALQKERLERYGQEHWEITTVYSSTRRSKHKDILRVSSHESVELDASWEDLKKTVMRQ